FEARLDRIDDLLDDVRKHWTELSAEEREAAFRKICLITRAAKIRFNRMLDRFGTQYREGAMRYVDLAYAAADLADRSGCSPKLRRSLRRHATEGEQERMRSLETARR